MTINEILKDFTVGGERIPVNRLHYDGKSETYITFTLYDEQPSLYADDKVQATTLYYDFDVYTKGNYIPIVKALKKILIKNGFMWVGDNGEDYNPETKQYHKSCEFYIESEEEING